MFEYIHMVMIAILIVIVTIAYMLYILAAWADRLLDLKTTRIAFRVIGFAEVLIICIYFKIISSI